MAVKKFWNIFAFCAVCAAVLFGCNGKKNDQFQSQSKVVTAITVIYENGNLRRQSVYTADNKMRAILNYLRWIDPYGTPAEDPESVDGSAYRITITFSNGGTKQYVQKADRYMRLDGQPWQSIDPKNAATLGQMLAKMESDEDVQTILMW